MAMLAAVPAVAAMLVAAASPAHTGAGARDVRPATAVAAAKPGTISRVAGGVGGPGLATTVALSNGQSGPGCGLAFGNSSLFISDGTTVRQVNPANDQLTTPAGNGVFGPLGNGGPAPRAALNACGLAFDQSGNLLIADSGNNEVRVVATRAGTFYGRTMRAGHIYVLAGVWRKSGYARNGTPATQARLRDPSGVAVDGAGNVVIADSLNERIRVVAARSGTYYGTAMTAGDIYTVAGDGGFGFAGDGGPATSAELNSPSSVAVDGTGNLVLADSENGRIRVVAVNTGTFYGQPMTAGDIYTVAGGGTSGSDGVPATSAKLGFPAGVAADGAGNLVISDSGSNRVRVVAEHTGTFYGQPMTAGDIYTVAGTGASGFSGDGGPATSAKLSGPHQTVLDGAGNLVIWDSSNNRVRVVAEHTGTFYGQPMTAGDIYTVAGTGASGFSGDGGPARAAELNTPEGVAADGAGNLVISDAFNNRVRVVAKHTGTFYGQPMTAGDIYTVAGNGTAGFSGNGGAATKARLNSPYDATVDNAGNLVIADFGNNRVRVVAVKTGTYYGQGMTAGHIYTVAGDGTFGFSGDGGPATRAKIGRPWKVTVDAAGNLVIGDSFNNRIRVVAVKTGTFYGKAMTAGDIYTVAGTGTGGFFGDGGPATSAELASPIGVAVDATGNLVIGDNDNQRLRVVAVKTGTFYGQAMTAGDIYTVAGGGNGSDWGVPATSVSLQGAGALTVDSAGNLIFSDNGLAVIVAERNGTFYGMRMTTGDIYELPGPYGWAFGLRVDSGGNLLIAGSNNRIWMITR